MIGTVLNAQILSTLRRDERLSEHPMHAVVIYNGQMYEIGFTVTQQPKEDLIMGYFTAVRKA